MTEEDDGPEDEDEGNERGSHAADGAEAAAKRGTERPGYAINWGRQRREREERARQQGQDGPQLILPAGLDMP